MQYRHIGKARIDVLDVVAGDEHEGHVAAGQQLRHRIDEVAAQVDVENGGIERVIGCAGERLGRPVERTDHAKSQLHERVPHHHGNQSFVLHQQNAVAIHHLRRRDRMLLVALGLTGEFALFHLVAAGNRHGAMQALLPPIEHRATTELAFNARPDDPRSISVRGGRLNGRSAGLSPVQHEAARS